MNNPAVFPVEEFREGLCLTLLDVDYPWRERIKEYREPISRDAFIERTTYQFSIRQDDVNSALEQLRQQEGQIARSAFAHRPPNSWAQIVPVARLPKELTSEFSVRNERGDLIAHHHRMRATRRTARFLLRHYLDVRQKGLGSQDQARAELLFRLVTFVNSPEAARTWEQNFLPLSFDNVATTADSAKIRDFLLADFEDYVLPFEKQTQPSATQLEALEEAVARAWIAQQSIAHQFRDFIEDASHASMPRDPWYNPFLLARAYAKLHQFQDRPFLTAHDALESFLVFTEAIRAIQADILHGLNQERRPPSKEASSVQGWRSFLAEVEQFSAGWVVYVDVDVAQDRPFVLVIERTTHLDAKPEPLPAPLKESAAAWHVYDFDCGDCESTHIEVCVKDPELEILNDKPEARPWVGIRQLNGSYLLKEPKEFFGATSGGSASTSNVHLYTTKRPIRTRTKRLNPKTLLERDAPVAIRLFVPYRVKRQIRSAYFAVIAGMVILALYGAYGAWNALHIPSIEGTNETSAAASASTPPANLQDVGVAAAGALTLTIVFAVNRHRHSLVDERTRKHAIAIIGLCSLTVATLLVSILLAFFGVRL